MNVIAYWVSSLTAKTNVKRRTCRVQRTILQWRDPVRVSRNCRGHSWPVRQRWITCQTGHSLRKNGFNTLKEQRGWTEGTFRGRHQIWVELQEIIRSCCTCWNENQCWSILGQDAKFVLLHAHTIPVYTCTQPPPLYINNAKRGGNSALFFSLTQFWQASHTCESSGSVWEKCENQRW